MSTDSVYKVIEIVGTSAESWEAAAKLAVETASSTLRDLRVAEVVKQDVTVKDGTVDRFRVRLLISFKHEHKAPRRGGTRKAFHLDGEAGDVPATGGRHIGTGAQARSLQKGVGAAHPSDGVLNPRGVPA